MISSEGIDLIKHFEGFSASAYKCPAGVWTIGYGSTHGVKEGDAVSREEADRMLQEDLLDVEHCIEQYVDVELAQCEYDALCSFIYNLGCGNFRQSTLLRLINNEDFVGAAKQFPRWNKAAGKVLPGLVARRKAEGTMFSGDEWRETLKEVA